MPSRTGIRHIVAVSDLHAGSSVAICPPGFELDDGGSYRLSRFQDVLWDYWCEFWDRWVPEVTGGGPYAVVVNGDVIDGQVKGSAANWSINLADQERAAIELLRPVAQKAAQFYLIRGTEAHVGKSAQAEERIAAELNAIGHGKTHSRWELWVKLSDGVSSPKLIHFAHHIGTTSSTAYESSALNRELVASFVESGQWCQEPPDTVIRCLSEDTELLTRYGWQGHDAVQIGDDVLTFNTFNGELQWQSAEAKVVNDLEPEMVHITGKGMDILVTPDHAMVVRSYTSRWGPGGWFPLSAGELHKALANKSKVGTCRQIPVAGWYEGVAVPLTAEQLWLLGLVMADGCYVRKPGGRAYAFRIAQADERAGEIESRLKAAGVERFSRSASATAGTPHYDSRKCRWVYTRRNCSAWYVPKEYAETYFPHIDREKCLRPHMLEMTAEQFGYLLAGFKYGDGSASQTRIHNSCKRILDQFQELFVKHGYKSHVCGKDAYTTKCGVTKCVYNLNYVPGKRAVIVGEKQAGHTIKTIPYDGQSWCVTVPNRTLVVRRKGCVAIVGNSHRHRFSMVTIPTERGVAQICVLPGWQLHTPYTHRLGQSLRLPQIGGVVLSAEHGGVTVRHKIWVPRRAEAVNL